MSLIIGLSGPSGVGKSYLKKGILETFPGFFDEIRVVTTRPARVNEGKDREAGLSLQEFERRVINNEVLFPHRPFEESQHFYGFSNTDIQSCFSRNRNILTEIHPSNIENFKSLFGNKVKVIGLVSSYQYLSKNMYSRNTERNSEISLRLDESYKEQKLIKEMFNKGLLDRLLEVNERNREIIKNMVCEIVGELIS